MRLLPIIALIALAACAQPIANPFKGGLFKRPVAATSAPAPVINAPIQGANGLGVAPIQTQTLAPLGQKPAPQPPIVAGQTGVGKTIPNPVTTVKPPAISKPPAPLLPPASPEEAECRKQGGTWATAGKSGAMTCFHPSKDSGKACSKQGDCTSQCLARSKTCAPFWPIFGCTEVLQKDGSLVKLCID